MTGTCIDRWVMEALRHITSRLFVTETQLQDWIDLKPDIVLTRKELDHMDESWFFAATSNLVVVLRMKYLSVYRKFGWYLSISDILST